MNRRKVLTGVAFVATMTMAGCVGHSAHEAEKHRASAATPLTANYTVIDCEDTGSGPYVGPDVPGEICIHNEAPNNWTLYGSDGKGNPVQRHLTDERVKPLNDDRIAGIAVYNIVLEPCDTFVHELCYDGQDVKL